MEGWLAWAGHRRTLQLQRTVKFNQPQALTPVVPKEAPPLQPYCHPHCCFQVLRASMASSWSLTEAGNTCVSQVKAQGNWFTP